MFDIFSIDGTYSLLAAVEKVKQPFTFLADTFFGTSQTVNTDYVVIEYRKAGRQLAPFVIRNSRGKDIARSTSQAKIYSPPMFAPRRTIGIEDLRLRQFGEAVSISTAPTAEERAARMVAQDMTDLLRLHANRRGQMAGEILQTGKLEMKFYADDGRVIESDFIDFDCANNFVVPLITWDNPDATIYDDLKAASERIQELCGFIPTVAVCGKNIERYLLQNTELKKWISIFNRENLNMLSFQPKFQSPQVRFIGYIQSLNLELVSYSQTYLDESGASRFFVEPDNVIIAPQNLGRTVYAPVTIFQDKQWRTIAAPHVPKYSYDDDAQTTAFTVYSRYLQIPDDADSWIVIKAKG